MTVKTAIDSLPATSVVTIRKLKSLGIKTFFDLINYFPFRYEDYSVVSLVGLVQDGETVTVQGEVKTAKNIYTRRRIVIQEVVVEDSTGRITARWFNQPFILKICTVGATISISGKVRKSGGQQIIEPSEFEPIKEGKELIHTARIIPIYPEKKGLSSKTIREKIHYILKTTDIDEFIPIEIIDAHNFLGENSAYNNVHFPEFKKLYENARSRLSFDELFIIQFSAYLVKREWKKERVRFPFEIDKFESKISDFISKLSFILTNSQKKSARDILNDLRKPQPMNRFLQGDVGSGKTVVATIACYISYLNGYQSLFMAPTEILAGQHFKTISSMLKPLGISTGLYTSSKKIHSDNVVVGTHSLLHQTFTKNKVGLVVVDEQHRFGVRQRAVLKSKGINPHLLTMTATPIPRTVALTLYGELDLSAIDEMPKGRLPVKTYLVSKTKRQDAYKWIEKKVRDEHAQIFIVCPLIAKSEKETMKSVKAATKEYEHLSLRIFPDLKIGLLHGKMKSKQKDEIMENFKKKLFNILVSTSVVEVGIDIPDATIIIIEGAERFGLAQLHQLRGRVGRRNVQSYCLLFTEQDKPQMIKRLQFFSKHTNGFEIAEYDLKVRGAGEVYGTKQHGITDLKIASLTDYPLIETVQKTVEIFNDKFKLEKYPFLKDRVEQYRVEEIARN